MDSTFYSQAGNFTGSRQRGVNARTGLFSIQIPIANLIGNDNIGPALNVSLNYDPLNNENVGLGIGFYFKFSAYDIESKRLTLSSGETYVVNEDSGGVQIQQQKLLNFKFERTSDSYRIVYKSGEIELLAGPQTVDSTKLLQTSFSPAGHALQFEWIYSPTPQLNRIADEKSTLLQIDYNGDIFTTINVFPGKAEERSVDLIFSNNHLTQIQNLATAESLNWLLGYEQVGPLYLLTKMAMPTGLIEQVKYLPDVMRFPDDAGLPPLPAVVNYVQSPGQGQPDITTVYSYTPQNYLGYGGNVGWDPDRDYVYGILNDYTYGSTEQTSSGDSTISISRVFNNFHLQTQEIVTQAACQKNIQIEYYALPYTAFDDQPSQFQLPKTTTVIYSDSRKTGDIKSRAESFHTAFDNAGNPTQEITPDGNQRDWLYYSAQGQQDNCPPEPNGFTRFLQSETVTPAKSDYAVPVRSKQYRYDCMPAAHVESSPVTALVVLTHEAHYSDGVLIHEKTTDYVNNPDSTEHGRVQRLTSVIYTLDEVATSYTSSLALTFEVDESADALLQSTTFEGHDKLTATTWRSQSRYSGYLLSRTDLQGNKETFSYDGLGRIVSHVLNPDTGYENVTTYAYTLTLDSQTQQVISLSTTMTDAGGNAERTYVDGLGRAVKKSRNDVDTVSRFSSTDTVWYDIELKEYDGMGRMIQVIMQDYLHPTSVENCSSQPESIMQLQYDDWGQHSLTSYNNGHCLCGNYDPVTMTYVSQIQGQTSSTSPESLIFGKIVTQYNLQRLPVSVTRYDLNGIEQGTILQSFDGLRQLRKVTDELGQKTQYLYDAFGRVTSTTLADDTTITKSYAPFSTGTLVTGITVTDTKKSIPLGNQVFNSLKFLLQTSSGGRTYGYTYDGVGPRPTGIMNPAGELISCKYIPPLHNRLSELTAEQSSQTYAYDSLTGKLTDATEGSGVARHMDHFPSGFLKSDTLTPLGSTQKSMNYVYSLCGRIQHFTDATGITQTYSYDELGRHDSIDDSNINVKLTYDDFGRFIGHSATDKITSQTVQMTLTLDEFNREVKREYSWGKSSLRVSQRYRKNGQLDQRITERDDKNLRSEQYGYDARNRTTNYQCAGPALPVDAYGKAIQQYVFSYDALSNMTACTIYFDGGSNTASFHYENMNDPNQLTSVTHTHPDYPKNIALGYDPNGRLIVDEAGRSLSYDVLGRLQSISGGNTIGGTYEYDALNTMVGQIIGDDDHRELYYRSGVLVNEFFVEKNQYSRLNKAGKNCVGLSTESVTH